VLSANGIEKSKTRPRSICVDPTSGATIMVIKVRAPNPATVRTNRLSSVIF
jgi:hypothetical protein